jgi:hypothetical protein
MRYLGGVLAFWPGLLRPAGTCAIGIEADLLGQHPQCGKHLSGTPAAEDAPFVLRDRPHHAVIRVGDVVGDLGEGECLIDGVARDAAQRRHHPCSPVGDDEGQTKAAEGRLGIAQGLNCRLEVRFELLERGLQRPTLPVSPGHPCGRGLA